MVALIDQGFYPSIIDDQLLLAMYELELSATTGQDQPPRSPGCTAIDGVPRPRQRCSERHGYCGACEGVIRKVGPLRVYSRSPPGRCLV